MQAPDLDPPPYLHDLYQHDLYQHDPHRGNRHRRSEQERLAVLEAADDLLAERGFANLTIEVIATRAGVAKQTIYRWWASKSEILFHGLIVDAEEFFTVKADSFVSCAYGR